MSFLAERPPVTTRAVGDLPPSPIGAPVAAALHAVGGGLVPVAVPTVLAWVFGPGGQATWSQAVRLSLGLWLLSQHTGLTVSGGHLGLVPLGLTMVPLTSTWFAGRRLARVMDPRAERIAAGASRAEPARLSAGCLLVFCGAYILCAALASVAAGMPGMRPVSAQAVLGAGVVALVGGGLGAAGYRLGSLRAVLADLLRSVPAPVRACLRPATAAAIIQLTAGAATVAVLIVTHASGVAALDHALQPGVVGEAVLTFGQVLLAPNLVIWACAVLAGPGFAIGSGTAITVAASHLGPLPAVPVLAALPAPGAMPAAALALLAVPVLSGVAAGLLIARRDGTAAARVVQSAITAAIVGLGAGVLAWLSGGPAGPGRLAEVGPQPWWVAAAVGLEVFLGAAATVLIIVGVPAGCDLAVRCGRDLMARRTTGPTETPGPTGTPGPAARAWGSLRAWARGARSDAAPAADAARTPSRTAADPGE